MANKKMNDISRIGFRFSKGSAHTSRTMMLGELRLLLSYVGSLDATQTDYRKAVEEDNCLCKRSGKNRELSWRYLSYLYSFDPSIAIFRSLLYFWNRDIDGQPLLAVMCAYGRDALLRTSAPFIMSFKEGEMVSRQALEEFIGYKDPGHFSMATLKSMAQNLNATWTKSGHLTGKAKKIRSRAKATPGSVAYALFLGYLNGARGEALFTTEYARLLDCQKERAIELAEAASRSGWIVFKRIGNVVEVRFPNLLAAQEGEWIREQDQTAHKIIQ
jgi:hypothetical protein